MGVAKGLKVHCLFIITEVSIRCQKNPEVGIRRIPAYTNPQYTTTFVYVYVCVCVLCITVLFRSVCISLIYLRADFCPAVSS